MDRLHIAAIIAAGYATRSGSDGEALSAEVIATCALLDADALIKAESHSDSDAAPCVHTIELRRDGERIAKLERLNDGLANAVAKKQKLTEQLSERVAELERVLAAETQMRIDCERTIAALRDNVEAKQKVIDSLADRLPS